MKWSYPIAKVAGIELRLHVTFLLLLGLVALSYGQVGGLSAALYGVAFIVLLFLCVLLHEFGHAFAARGYGIRTPDITLLPIGGVARLERAPDTPVQELVVAIAGPAVNVVIALVLWLALGRPMTVDDPEMFDRPSANLAAQLLQVNILLVLFNLIPAFPMDGGRIFRALLAMRLDRLRATMIAARTGQAIAVGFAAWSIFGSSFNPFLLFIAMVVFSGAQQEIAYTQLRSRAQSLRVADVMSTRFQSYLANTPIAAVREAVALESQSLYPLTDDRLRVVGIVRRNEILGSTASSHDALAAIATVVPTVEPRTSIGEAFELMQTSSSPVLPVVNPAGQILGLVSLNLMRERIEKPRAA